MNRMRFVSFPSVPFAPQPRRRALARFVVSLVLSALPALAAGTAFAQWPAAPAAGGAAAAGANPPANGAHPIAPTAQWPVPEEHAANGVHNAIAVHGHWTIEVRNPDGTLVTHREFENSLQTSGAAFIEDVLLGIYTIQGYEVGMGGTNSAQTPASQPAACAVACEIFENIPPNNQNCPAGSPTFFCTLTRSPAIGTPVTLTSLGMTFQGTITAPQAGYVGVVELGAEACTNGSANTTNSLSPVSPQNCETGNYTNGPDSLIFQPFVTSTYVNPPVQVAAAGQMISVTVQVSFN
jgi:hypothetical protein